MKSGARRTRIVCLPKAGPENPYQKLMIDGLSSSTGVQVTHGIDNKFLGLLLSAMRYRPTYIHFDWLHRYYYRNNVVLTVLLLPLFFFQVLIIRSWFNVKLVWTLHNIEPHDIRFPAIHRVVRRFFAKNCHWIRVFSNSTVERAAAYLKVSPRKFKIIPEGDYTTYYPNQVTKSEARAYFGLPLDSKVYLCLGLIKPYKGIKNLVNHFNLVKRPNEYLIVAGKVLDAAYGNQIRKIMSDRVIFFDRFVEPINLQYFFNAADVVVLPFSKIENSGSVILAMGFAKPIIAPSSGTLTERLQHQSQLLFKEKVEEVWATQLSYSDHQLSSIGRENLKAVGRFHWSDFVMAFF